MQIDLTKLYSCWMGSPGGGEKVREMCSAALKVLVVHLLPHHIFAKQYFSMVIDYLIRYVRIGWVALSFRSDLCYAGVRIW